MNIKAKAQIGDKWYTLSREFKALFWSAISLLAVLAGAIHCVYGMVIWTDTARSTQHLIAGLVFLYMSQHPALKKRSGEDKNA